MRKILPLLVVGFLVLSGLGAVSGSESVKEELTSERVVFSSPIVQTEDQYVTITIDEAESFIMEQGKPMLPCYTEQFTFPVGTKITSVTCTPKTIQTQEVPKDVKPTPQRAIAGVTVIQTKEAVYGTEKYPATWFEYDLGGGIKNGERCVIVNLQVNPIKYSPVDKTIEWAKEVDVKITYEPAPISEPVLEQYEFLIICANEYTDELASLVSHKQSNGLTVKLADLSTVYASAPGADNQEKIKYYIKDAIDNWQTTSVLLVGSATQVPTRTVYVYFEEGDDDEIFISDLYYADIYDEYNTFMAWDSNGNGQHAEFEWDGETDTDVDFYPDVYFGRWAATSGSQVTNCIDKVENYEDNVAYQQDWFTNLVVVGGDSFDDVPYGSDVLEGEFINDIVIDIMAGFIPNKQWVTNGQLTQPLLGITNVKNAIGAGCGFVDFSGHGNPQCWATHPYGDYGTWVPTPSPPGGIFNINVQSLSNNYEPAIVTVEACSTAKFNSNSNCFNWAFMHQYKAGAVGAFGATALGWGYIGDGVSEGLIGKMGLDTFRGYRLDDATTLGEMWANGLGRSIMTNMDGAERKTILEWQSFGDPTLLIAEESNPPNKPSTPSGPPSGGVGTEYIYTASATDPDGDQVAYNFNWGDGTSSGWTSYVNSGSTGSATKTWYEQGTYAIKVVAKDTHGKISEWSDEFTVTMPRGRNVNSFIVKFLENHPNIFPVLRMLLGL